MTDTFAIFRRDSHGFSPRGPVAPFLTLTEAKEQLAALSRQYPAQEFVIMGEVGTAKRSERVTVKVEAPQIGTPKQKKAPEPKQTAQNVTPLRKATP